MKTKIIYLTITCAALLGATPAPAQFRPTDPVGRDRIRIDPPLKIDPIITFEKPITSPDTEGTAGGPPDRDPPATFGQTFVIAVCAGTSDISDECLDRGTAEAVRRLSELYLEEYEKKVVEKSLAVRFPDAMTETEQLKFLTTVEKAVVSMVVGKIQADLRTMNMFKWDAPKQAELDNDAKQVTQWNERARAEANNGSNWSHNWHSNTHIFHEGNAYRQLQYVGLHGWRGT